MERLFKHLLGSISVCGDGYVFSDNTIEYEFSGVVFDYMTGFVGERDVVLWEDLIVRVHGLSGYFEYLWGDTWIYGDFVGDEGHDYMFPYAAIFEKVSESLSKDILLENLKSVCSDRNFRCEATCGWMMSESVLRDELRGEVSFPLLVGYDYKGDGVYLSKDECSYVLTVGSMVYPLRSGSMAGHVLDVLSRVVSGEHVVDRLFLFGGSLEGVEKGYSLSEADIDYLLYGSKGFEGRTCLLCRDGMGVDHWISSLGDGLFAIRHGESVTVYTQLVDILSYMRGAGIDVH